MPDLGSTPAPMSEAVTDDIRVEVMANYSSENSNPLLDNWVFQYTVRITNQGSETVQLVSRHWIITDGVGHTEEVKGPGVVGEQPVLAPGESFQYSSWCPLKTPRAGCMAPIRWPAPTGTSSTSRSRPSQAFSHRRMSLNEGSKEGSEQGVLS